MCCRGRAKRAPLLVLFYFSDQSFRVFECLIQKESLICRSIYLLVVDCCLATKVLIKQSINANIWWNKTKFTVYRHQVFDFACRWTVIIQISKLIKSYTRARDCQDPTSQLRAALKGCGPKVLYIILYLKTENF